MNRILEAINKEQLKYDRNYQDNGLRIVHTSGKVVYLKDNNGNDFYCRITETGKYKKDSFHG